FQMQHAELRQDWAASLQTLAEECRQDGLTEAAEHIRQLTEPAESEGLHAEPLPATVQPEVPWDLPAAERRWRLELRRLQTEYALDLFILSRRALRAGAISYALDLVREVVRHDPDHAPARQILGDRRRGDQWVTEFTAEMMDRGQVWHERFGWLPKSHVERYENGERYFRGSWISAAREAEIRRDFRHAWTVATEHFLVKTNHSLERGVEVATLLEDYYAFFTQTFAGFFNTPEQIEDKFRGRSRRARDRNERRYEVHYYATQDEYIQRLITKIPQIGITNGLYYPADRVSYFFHDDNADNTPLLFHEATHQFLYEISEQDRLIAEERGFWIIEGIACYMESFERKESERSLGNPRYVRFTAARYRLLNDDYYVPLQEFAAMSKDDFQTAREISKNYSQAAGLAHFFMHYDGGRYRDALIEHLAQHYDPNQPGPGGVQSLAALTGVPFAELDRQYREHMESLQRALSRPR
ncbi:MAG: DUF1570 domain-containing protein, partial [Planctomycetaceae bacterium]